MLEVNGLQVAYGQSHVLHGIDLSLRQGELRAVVGPNGAGKTTLIRTILGLVRPLSGEILLDGESIVGEPPHRIARRAVAWISEGRGIFSRMTVEENLSLGAFGVRDPARRTRNLATVLEQFPRLAERRRQLAGTLSGGEQQMLAIARAQMANPRLLLVDEPSLGLSPLIVNEVFRILKQIHANGTTVLLVEQNARKAMQVADWVYVLETGTVAHSGPPAAVARDGYVAATYLGHSGGNGGSTG